MCACIFLAILSLLAYQQLCSREQQTHALNVFRRSTISIRKRMIRSSGIFFYFLIFFIVFRFVSRYDWIPPPHLSHARACIYVWALVFVYVSNRLPEWWLRHLISKTAVYNTGAIWVAPCTMWTMSSHSCFNYFSFFFFYISGLSRSLCVLHKMHVMESFIILHTVDRYDAASVLFEIVRYYFSIYFLTSENKKMISNCQQLWTCIHRRKKK